MSQTKTQHGAEVALNGNLHRSARRWGPLAALAPSFSVVFLSSSPALANSAFGLQGLLRPFFLLIGLMALILSAMLGAAGWITALNPPKSARLVFGRGFLGVSAVLAFAVGALGVAVGFERWLWKDFTSVLPVIVVLVPAFMAVEFFIAATLYRRANAEKKSTGVTLLSVASYVIGGLLSLVTALALLVMLFAG